MNDGPVRAADQRAVGVKSEIVKPALLESHHQVSYRAAHQHQLCRNLAHPYWLGIEAQKSLVVIDFVRSSSIVKAWTAQEPPSLREQHTQCEPKHPWTNSCNSHSIRHGDTAPRSAWSLELIHPALLSVASTSASFVRA